MLCVCCGAAQSGSLFSEEYKTIMRLDSFYVTHLSWLESTEPRDIGSNSNLNFEKVLLNKNIRTTDHQLLNQPGIAICRCQTNLYNVHIFSFFPAFSIRELWKWKKNGTKQKKIRCLRCFFRRNFQFSIYILNFWFLLKNTIALFALFYDNLKKNLTLKW